MEPKMKFESRDAISAFAAGYTTRGTSGPSTCGTGGSAGGCAAACDGGRAGRCTGGSVLDVGGTVGAGRGVELVGGGGVGGGEPEAAAQAQALTARAQVLSRNARARPTSMARKLTAGFGRREQRRRTGNRNLNRSVHAPSPFSAPRVPLYDILSIS